ncbi:MAG: bifunctional 4-hydroxy-2-oxoglutarate aldolase/2-dehydro-3-deoxy-phosphogluconate aldolase [Gammaproteobacteria bacterium]|nr:bifunctional 4-hydroxy-2-oxoglutarate aldolase/2-dehydro-3-deoxy-phosphogluconate aldolase [Gammaproteobacteria bacterium]MDH3430831.1 bifunctional 4-hydroxy-2-oxoglutarate aldolase/2-dehydro-3-deoxy-phosphogluconate aldolase [Gammaproteobacteria bacterium]MDH3433432.1 bifunctional 4-hydroxy-2-oxoglutarate aldolase/2-dehydro-3-deoxy-phosphogluconate aldolase [Gammaproteobacteria bacterium]
MKKMLEESPVVPVVVIDDAEKAVPVAKALLAGGLPVIEVTMRTAAAADAIAAIAAEVPGAHVGAGTVLSAEHARTIVAAGAKFIVSPGLHEDVVSAARELRVPIIPGVATATEAQRAWNLGLRILKFFPAGQAGGAAMIKALASVFRDVMFMPTGGVSTSNLKDYLALPAVLACGGSWLTPADAIADGDFDQITALASEALAIAKEARGAT